MAKTKVLSVENIQGLDEYILNKFYPITTDSSGNPVYPRYVQLAGMPEPTTFGGTWEVDTTYDGKALWVDSTQDVGTSLDGSLPKIEAEAITEAYSWSGAFKSSYTYSDWGCANAGSALKESKIVFKASDSNSVYSASAGTNVVRPTSMTVKVWKRTA